MKLWTRILLTAAIAIAAPFGSVGFAKCYREWSWMLGFEGDGTDTLAAMWGFLIAAALLVGLVMLWITYDEKKGK